MCVSRQKRFMAHKYIIYTTGNLIDFSLSYLKTYIASTKLYNLCKNTTYVHMMLATANSVLIQIQTKNIGCV